MNNSLWQGALICVVAAGLGCASVPDRQGSTVGTPSTALTQVSGELPEQAPNNTVTVGAFMDQDQRETTPSCGEDELGTFDTENAFSSMGDDLVISSDADLSGDEQAGAPETGEPDASPSGQSHLDVALGHYEASKELWSQGNMERAMEELDQAYGNILEVKTDDDLELIQQVEDLRFMISKRILEIYASRHTVVNGLHKEIPLVMNKHVQQEIDLFQTRERSFFIESYQRSGKYRSDIVKALNEAGLPEELSWLPLIESGFKVRALSRARALGLWQFIPSTGYKFGLQRDAWVDDRLDPERSTAAAIAYLKELHGIFGDWTTVLAAYNCGEGAVLRKIRQQKINYLDDFWDLYQELPRETARYVPRFLATLHILKDPTKFGLDLGEPDAPLRFDRVTVTKQVHLKDVAKAMGVSYELLKELNPHLRLQATPASTYVLNVPETMGERLLASLDSIPKWVPPQRAYVQHRVKQGETLSTIARKYRASMESIARANNIRKRHLIRIGQTLKIPLRGVVGGAAGAYASTEIGSDGTYRVREGDSLWLLGQKFKMSTEEIQRMNNLDSTLISVGQVLKVRHL